MYILDSCQRHKQGSKNTICHPEERSELRILPVINDCQEHWSDSEHPQSSQTCNDKCFRMTLLRSVQTAALTLALSFFIAAPVMAADTPPVPASVQTDNSAYTLTKVESPNADTITQYEYSQTENKLVPVYYRVDLSKIEYGDKLNSSDTLYFKFENINGRTVLVDGSESDHDITYYVNEKRLASDRVTSQNNTNIDNDFVGLQAHDGAAAAVINNPQNTVGSITGDFVNNTNSIDSGLAYGGAITNAGNIDKIEGTFANNSASASKNNQTTTASVLSMAGEAHGGAISNVVLNTSLMGEGTLVLPVIKSISGDFIGNYAEADYVASGGALHNEGIIGSLNANFINNYAVSFEGNASGGAISNEYGAEIGDVNGDFIGNYVTQIQQSSGAQTMAAMSGGMGGGAIYNSQADIGNITGDFIKNYALSPYYSAMGGAILNESGQIGNITGDFIANYAQGTYTAMGGAIANTSVIGNIKGNFMDNKAVTDSQMALGGAIANFGVFGKIEEVTGSTRQSVHYEFTPGEIINSSFVNNVAENKNADGIAAGGAIFSITDLNITADNGLSLFSGNKTIKGDKEESNAISIYGIGTKLEDGTYVYVDLASMITGYETVKPDVPNVSKENPATLTLKAVNNGVIRFDDKIKGGAIDMSASGGISEIGNGVSTLINAAPVSVAVIKDPSAAFNLKITGDSTGKVILNNDVINANISLDNTNLYLGRENVFDESQKLSLNSGSMYMTNNSVGTMHIPVLNLNGDTNLAADVDLKNAKMDRITADTYNVNADAYLNVNQLNLLNDATKDVTHVLFADKELAPNVQYTGINPVAYSKIWKYDVSYGTNPEDKLGYFTFVRGAAGNANSYNPSVLAAPVVQQAGAYTTQLQAFNYAFQHADTFMNIPYIERVAMKNQGRYALSPTGDATDIGTFSPLLTKEEDAGFWVKPYASFESIPLKNGQKVSNINYGTLVGYDSPLTTLSNGWERVLTGYIGYNGASQRYQGVDAYQNGGLLGSTATFYKGNFFNATTLSVGASAGDASTMYGSENYTMLMAGIGNKTGYNIEFWDGKMIFQPSMLISYSFINTFDYNNAAGVRIDSDPLHAIQLAPGIKLIGNTKNGWQPYIGVNMVWNLLNDTKVMANDVRLPEMSIRPYVQYGAGVQRRFNNDFLGYFQTMIHNGGRNGVSLTAGLRWNIGNK